MSLLSIKLKMIKESLNLKYYSTIAICTLSECETFFKTNMHQEGKAELQFLRALWEIQSYSVSLNEQSTKVESFDQRDQKVFGEPTFNIKLPLNATPLLPRRSNKRLRKIYTRNGTDTKKRELEKSDVINNSSNSNADRSENIIAILEDACKKYK